VCLAVGKRGEPRVRHGPRQQFKKFLTKMDGQLTSVRDGAAGPLRADGVPQGLAAPSAGVRAAPHGLATVDDIVPGGCGTTVERER
jgi:hypothetical protein